MTEDTAAAPLETARADIRARAAAGDLLPVSVYTAASPVLADPPYLLGLVRADAAARLASGSPPDPESYAAEFPSHAAAIRAVFFPDSPAAGPSAAIPRGADGFPFLSPPAAGTGDLGRLGRFRIVRLIAEGGMGMVFEGYDPHPADRPVAVKVIRPELLLRPAPRGGRPTARDRLLNEARAAARIHDANVVSLYEVGTDGDVLFLVMPLLRGRTLAARLADGRLPAWDLVRVARGAAAGLAAAHALGLVHRDIKPSNLWLEPDAGGGRVLVLDFGLVLDPDRPGEATSETVILGTPPYMSPEQSRAIEGPTGPKSDLFSLGAVLYEAATGVRVFDRGNVTATLRAVAEFHPPPLAADRPDVPPAVAALVHELLAKDPAGRPASAAAVVVALDRLPPISADTRTWVGEGVPMSWWQKRRRAIVAAAALASAVAVAVAVAAGPERRVESDPRDAPPADGPAVELTGTADVEFVSGPGRMFASGLRDAVTLPARPGDRVRVKITMTAPAYLYVFLVAADGQIYPLYPWDHGRGWGSRPAAEAPSAALTLPPDLPNLPLDQVNAFTITGDDRGMESVVVVARRAVWADTDDAVRALFGGLGPRPTFPTEKAFAEYVNGEMITVPGRTRDFSPAAPAVAPHLQLQNLLNRRLRPHAAFTTAVSFAKLGKSANPGGE